MPQDVLEDDDPVLESEGSGCLDEILLFQELDLPLDKGDHNRDIQKSHHDHDVIDIRLECGDHEQDQHQAGE